MLTQEGQVLCTRLKQCLETGFFRNLEGLGEKFFVFLCACENDTTVLQPGKPFSDAKRCMAQGLTCASCSFIYLLPALKVVTESFFLFVETFMLPNGKFQQPSKDGFWTVFFPALYGKALADVVSSCLAVLCPPHCK